MEDIRKLKYDKGDPVAAFLFEKMRFTPFEFAIVWMSVAVILGVLAAFVSDSLFSTSTRVGLVADWVWWVWSFVFTPVIAGYYLWSSTAIESVIKGLSEAEILPIHEDDLKAVAGYFEKPWRKFLALFVMVAVGVLYYLTRDELSGFAASSMLARIETSILYSVLAYFLVMLIAKLVINYLAIRRIVLGKKLNINPLHPDRCGGLRVLSDYSIKVVYLNAVFGILVSITAYRIYTLGYIWATVLVVAFYLLVATVSFFAPLSTAHEEMKNAKSDLLLKLGKQFWQDYLAAHESIGDNSDTLKNELAKIKQLQELYDLTRGFPVWPFDTTTLQRFFITITSPLIPPIIGILVDFVAGLFRA